MDKNKLNKLNIRNFVKNPQNRLGSLALPRDLSLGGTKKKVYVPNLNAVRTKHKTKDIVNKLSQERIKKGFKPKEKHDSSSRFIRSSGVFSEGASNAFTRPSQPSERFSSSYKDVEPSITVPKLNKIDWTVNKKDEDEVVDCLLNIENDSSASDSDYEPVVLPLMCEKESLTKTVKLKKEKVTIKQEFDSNVNLCDQNNEVKTEDFAATLSNQTIFNGIKLFSDDDLALSLLKMPDSFPGKGFDDTTDELVDYTVKHMHEGQIGKIQIRQSGKIEVSMGNAVYLLDAEETPPFLEEIMIMPDQSEAYTVPLMGRVGPITDRFVLSPNWKNLFLNSKIKKL